MSKSSGDLKVGSCPVSIRAEKKVRALAAQLEPARGKSRRAGVGGLDCKVEIIKQDLPQ